MMNMKRAIEHEVIRSIQYQRSEDQSHHEKKYRKYPPPEILLFENVEKV